MYISCTHPNIQQNTECTCTSVEEELIFLKLCITLPPLIIYCFKGQERFTKEILKEKLFFKLVCLHAIEEYSIYIFEEKRALKELHVSRCSASYCPQNTWGEQHNAVVKVIQRHYKEKIDNLLFLIAIKEFF